MYLTRNRQFAFLAIVGVALVGAPPVEAGSIEALLKRSFRTQGDKVLAWNDLAGAKASVVVFLSFDCPVSTSYSQLLADLARDYQTKGVSFVGFCPCDDDAGRIAAQASEHRLGFPVFKDDQFAVADALGAKTTPQVFVLDAKNDVIYTGLIDDGYVKRLVPSRKVSKSYLKDALDAAVAGKALATAKTEPIGCRIARETKNASTGAVTYHRDVEPILQNHCQSCHRPGEVGPFSLLTYKQAVNWAEDLKEYTGNHRMPPWKPTTGKPFQHERRLSDLDIRSIARWVDEGCPEGDPKDAPQPRQFVDGWMLGKPDLVLSIPEDFILGPTGRDHFRVYVIPTGLTEDKFVTALEVKPGNPRVVHHTLNFWDTSGTAREMQASKQAEELKRRKPGDVDVGPGYASGMGLGFRRGFAGLAGGKPAFGALSGWAPGIVPNELPPGTGYYLPQGSDFVMQVHYHRDGKLERDRIQVGLYFAKKPVEKPMLGMIIPGRFKTDGNANGNARGRFGLMGYIPANDEHFVAKGTWYANEDCTLYSVMPHMHLLGKSVKITMTLPGAKAETLIDIADWDYNWQEIYFLQTAIKVKAGTRFDIEAVYDNSAKNPNNPHDPPVDVRFGEQTTNEMCFGFLGATKDSSSPSYFIQQGPFAARR